MRVNVKIERTRERLSKYTETFIAKYENILAEYTIELSEKFDDAITGDYYFVPFASRRRFANYYGSRYVAPGLRNIVDSGQLLNSKTISTRTTKFGTSYEFDWTAPHAGEVRRGYITTFGNQMPGRDWIAEAFSKLPFKPFLQRRAIERPLNTRIKRPTVYAPPF